ncbi:MAG: PLP-dependent aminotransferase family protein [Desulfovibrionaceae bacterium]|nr:PLP-dependent aminotransferase family protein [Desulfovibrionaceae bacterium]
MLDPEILIRLYHESEETHRYRKLSEALRKGIHCGLFLPGDILPSQRVLADALNITLGTVSHAFREASGRGLISGVVGRGTFICAPASDVDMQPPDCSGMVVPLSEEVHTGASGESSGKIWNLGFIAPFDFLDPPLGSVLSRLSERLTSQELSDLQACRRPAGLDRHREAGALWARRYGVPASGKDLLVCAGSQHALLVILASLLIPGDRIAVEILSYPILRRLALRLRFDLAPIRTDDFGMLPDALENACRSGGIRAVYLMPSCRNPTLGRIPENRRRELVEVCRRYDVFIIEDDVFALAVRSDYDKTPSFAALAPERTYFIAATSEIFGGGLRIAYLCPPQSCFEELERTVSYTVSMVPPLMAEIVSQWILDGTADRTILAKKEEARLRNGIARAIFDGQGLVSRETGFFCWLRLPSSWTGIDFARAARKENILIAEGEHFMMGHALMENGVRIALGGVAERDTLQTALSRLSAILEK